MSHSEDKPQIYLITPPAFEPQDFAERMARILDDLPIACIRLGMATQDEDAIARAADALRAQAHARDVALVIERHQQLVAPLGLDGVHLPDGAGGVRRARAALGGDAIVGAFCATSRHAGMTAGEAGADYIAFGPVGETTLGDGSRAEHALFEWWSQMIELPVVAEGALTKVLVESLAPVTDFFAVGEEIWRADDPRAALRQLMAPLGPL